MADESDPPRVFYQLKPRDFERVNAVPGEPSPSASAAPGEIPHPNPSARIEVGDIYQQAAVPGPVLSMTARTGPKNDVHVILKQNLNRANAAGLNEITYKPKRRSRRTRDYFLVVIPLNAFFGFAAFGPFQNAGTLAYGCAGILISTIGLGWVMFFVMDDY